MRFWLLFLSVIGWSQALFNELPCDFLDSIDISSGVLQANKSIIYSGVEYRAENYGEINYILDDEMKPIIVEPYFRGCPCQIKSCVRLCCPYGSFVDKVDFILEQQQQIITCRNHSAAKNFMADILHENNETKTLNLDQHFTYLNRICKNHFFAEEFNITEVIG